MDGLREALITMLILVPSALWLWFLVEAIRVPRGQWDAAGLRKLTVVLIMVVFNLLGTFMYLATTRRTLLRAQAIEA